MTKDEVAEQKRLLLEKLKGIKTIPGLAKFQSALLADLMAGKVSPEASNAAQKAYRTVLKELKTAMDKRREMTSPQGGRR